MLYLKGILVVFLLVQNCFAQFKQINGEEGFNRFVIETSIRGWCSEKWGELDFSRLDFDKYKDSIFKVIAEAIADCILRRKEFAETPLLKDGNIKIIEFKGTNVTEYVRSNWNAVIMYNYLSLVINGSSDLLYDIRRNLIRYPEKGIEYVAQKVKQYYKNKGIIKDKPLNGFIKKATNDVNFYCKNLKLYEYLNSLINGTDNGNDLCVGDRTVSLRNVYEINYNKRKFKIFNIDVKYKNNNHMAMCDIDIDENCVPHYRIKTRRRDKIEGENVLDVELDEYFNITQIILNKELEKL